MKKCFICTTGVSYTVCITIHSNSNFLLFLYENALKKLEKLMVDTKIITRDTFFEEVEKYKEREGKCNINVIVANHGRNL